MPSFSKKIEALIGKTSQNEMFLFLYVRSPEGHILLQSRKIFFLDCAETFFLFWTPRTQKLQ